MEILNDKYCGTTLRIKVDSSIPDQDGHTILHISAIHTAGNVVRMLLERIDKLTIDLKDSDGCRALHHAIRHNRCSCIKLLLERVADPTISDKQGMDALDAAIITDDPTAVKLLMYMTDDNDYTKNQLDAVEAILMADRDRTHAEAEERKALIRDQEAEVDRQAREKQDAALRESVGYGDYRPSYQQTSVGGSVISCMRFSREIVSGCRG